MSFIVAKKREVIGTLLITLGLTGFFTMGFLPTAHEFGQFLGRVGLAESLFDIVGFPLLSAVFYFSLPRAKYSPDPQWPLARLGKILVVPLLISLLFGFFHPQPSIFAGNLSRETMLWYLFAVPLGEELLFRGWMGNLVERLWPGRMLTLTNPLPLWIWASALAFSFWHLQNLSKDPAGLVIFQCGYTFIVGLVLGWVRWKSGSLLPAIVAHIAINLASVLL